MRGVKYIPAKVQLEDLDPRVNLASSFTDRALAGPGVRDAGVGEDAPVGAEGERVDGVGVVEGVEVLAVVEVPEHRLGVLTAGGTEGAVRAHGHRVEVAWAEE